MLVEYLGSGDAIHVASLERDLEAHHAIGLELDAGIRKVDLMGCQPGWTEDERGQGCQEERGSACTLAHEAAPTAFKSSTMPVAL